MTAGGEIAFWQVLSGLILVMAVQQVKVRQRRTAINQALHEIRRPLQSLALAEHGPGDRGISDLPPEERGQGGTVTAATGTGAVWQAIRAVGLLDRELNGGTRHDEPRELIACRLLSDSCIRRCGPRAQLAGARIQLRWIGPDALVRGDGTALAAAIENLLLNAIEHGGPEITVNALTVARRLRIEVIDSGSRSARSGGRSARNNRLRRRPDCRHGHGLRVARRAAEVHGGRLSIKIGELGSRAALVLPVDEAGAGP